MRTTAVLVLGLAACVSPANETQLAQPIIGGETANPAEFPSVVALEEAPGDWFCTGTLIASEWVLTAGHCVVDAPTATLNVRFGDGDVNDAYGGTVVAAKSVYTHEGFDWDAWDNDIALVKLAAPVTDHAPTAIHRDAVPAETTVLDVGYGVIDNDDNGGGVLRKVEKRTADCAGANDPEITNTNLICMDVSDGRGSCFGDSGGPTFATLDGARVVVGVTSGGTGDLCGAGWDLYTSVNGELPFVDAVLAGMVEPDEPVIEDPAPTDPTEGEPEPEEDGDGDGGCSTGGGHGLGLLLLGMLAAIRRRR